MPFGRPRVPLRSRSNVFQPARARHAFRQTKRGIVQTTFRFNPRARVMPFGATDICAYRIPFQPARARHAFRRSGNIARATTVSTRARASCLSAHADFGRAHRVFQPARARHAFRPTRCKCSERCAFQPARARHAFRQTLKDTFMGLVIMFQPARARHAFRQTRGRNEQPLQCFNPRARVMPFGASQQPNAP